MFGEGGPRGREADPTDGSMRILAGDIGGTTTRLALFDGRGTRLRKLAEAAYPSREWRSLEGPVAAFLAEAGSSCSRAGFGLAGPVQGRVVRITNLPWMVEADSLAQRFGFDEVALINDLEAAAWAIGDVRDDEVSVLQAGRSGAAGNAAVVAAGTGLGVAGMYWDGRRHHPFACEGGHAGFAPSGEEEWALLRHLEAAHGRVSWERVVSGPGLVAVHEVVAARDGLASAGGQLGSGDAAAAIAAAAAADPTGTAARAVRLFAGLYGAVAGDVALTMMASGGVWLGGGIAPKLLSTLAGGGFMERFLAKGRMRPLLEAMPVRVVLKGDVALWGAARCAQRRRPGRA
jgi:glucokinase